ncbi:hypothetical protein PF008_g23793 [Phytophthora fragariae]|uniref:Uncharacterized protein n=1 Tax=Phytophthora fragariae TaxID=53985 RepID=A0A6G0QPX2_9STRA|nr:hypothetical protein PF008_g23793 [Phytophthora fragariae]
MPACAHYDAGETISKLVTNPLRQLSAPTRVSEHPTPGRSTLVTLSDGQVALLLQLNNPGVETVNMGSDGFSTPLRRPPHGHPPSSILRRARCGTKFAGLSSRHFGLGGYTEGRGSGHGLLQLVDTGRAATELLGVYHQERVGTPKVVL